MKPKEWRKLVLTPYVRNRLRQEIGPLPAGRKRAARIAESVGVEPATISAIKSGDRNVGEDSEAGFAGHWKISVEELRSLAQEEYERRTAGVDVPERSARIQRLVEAEGIESLTLEQNFRLLTLAASGDNIDRAAVRHALYSAGESIVDAELEREQDERRGKRRKPR